jgi:hypothetical protein
MVKQGCKLAPTLFGIYTAFMLCLQEHQSILQYQRSFQMYHCDLFQSKTISKYIREA